MIKGIIFDLDGTLLNTLEDLKNSVNYSLVSCLLDTISLDETREYVGNGVYNLIESAVGKHKEQIQKCYEIFKEHYSKNSKIYTKPYEGAKVFLNGLKDKNIKLAVLSNKLDSMVKNLVEYYFSGIFDIVMGESKEFPKKPDSKACDYIINEFKLNKENVIFIGDSNTDIKTAKNVGIECISVSWGYKSKDFLIKNGAKNIIDSFDEIYKFI